MLSHIHKQEKAHPDIPKMNASKMNASILASLIILICILLRQWNSHVKTTLMEEENEWLSYDFNISTWSAENVRK